jgi:diguanylate cyclase (GGDEF)-like protein/PAS domain S-box-containing protein
MDIGQLPTDGTKGSSFFDRLWTRVVDPTILAVPIVVVVFWIFRANGLIADISVPQIVMLLAGAYFLSALAVAIWPGSVSGWRIYFRIGTELGAISVVIYAVGWGPTLGLGLIFGVADCMRTDGSTVETAALVCSVTFIGLGQGAIALGLAPSLVPSPLVHALAGLVVLGLIFTTKLLGWVFATKEGVEASLLARERRFRALVDQAADVIVVVDEEEHITYLSPAFEELLGYSEEKATALVASDLAHPDDLERLASALDATAAPEPQTGRTEARLRTADGGWLWFEIRLANRLDDPDVCGIVANLHDITERKKYEEALREAEERFRRSFEEAPIGIALVDKDGRILSANKAYGDILGYESRALTGLFVQDFTYPDDLEATLAGLRRLFSGETDAYHLEKRYVHADGHEVWISLHVSCVRDPEGSALYSIGQIEDITERRALNQLMAHAAIHDPLTDLPNRVLFMDRLEMAMSRAERAADMVAVVFVDLDHFKLINDAMGHDAGDRLLTEVAVRIRNAVRPADTVARLGGDEFTILIEEIADDTAATEAAERVAAALGVPFELDGAEVFISASMGIALSPPGPESAELLLRDADAAMYRAKELGRGSIEVYDPGDDLWAVTRLQTGTDLNRAIQRDELELHYQPVINLERSALVGVEALARWRHPKRGLLPPSEFIDLAEDTGMIVRLGEWALRQACTQVAEWNALRALAADELAPLHISVNVSPRQLAEKTFPSQVAEIIHQTGINPDVLWLEITENTLMRDPKRAISSLGALREQGVHLAVDDFGTGYSSLSYLKQLPVESLKIDRTFVDGLGEDPEDTAIVKAIIGLAASLGLASIAEGVETAPQARDLKKLGCLLAQGYLFGRPLPPGLLGVVPADDLTSWHPSPRRSALRA